MTSDERAPKQPPTDALPAPEDIDNAIRWLRANEQKIRQALPIKTLGVTYLQGWSETVHCRAQQWENKEIPLNLAVCYILLPLRAVRESIRQR